MSMDISQWDVNFQHGAGYIRFLHRDPSRLRLAFYTKEADAQALKDGGYTTAHEASFPGYKPRGRTLVRVVFVVRAYKASVRYAQHPVFSSLMERSFANPPRTEMLGPLMVYDWKSPQEAPLSVRECSDTEDLTSLLSWKLGEEEIIELLDAFKPGWGSACYSLLNTSGRELDVQAMEDYYMQGGQNHLPADEQTPLEDWPLSL